MGADVDSSSTGVAATTDRETQAAVAAAMKTTMWKRDVRMVFHYLSTLTRHNDNTCMSAPIPGSQDTDCAEQVEAWISFGSLWMV